MPEWNTTEAGVIREREAGRRSAYFADQQSSYDGLSMLCIESQSTVDGVESLEWGNSDDKTLLDGLQDEVEKDSEYNR